MPSQMIYNIFFPYPQRRTKVKFMLEKRPIKKESKKRKYKKHFIMVGNYAEHLLGLFPIYFFFFILFFFLEEMIKKCLKFLTG